jgi:hypothetical protein
MARPAGVLVALLAALVLPGCGSGSRAADETTGELVVSIEPAKLPDRLAANECFAAVRGLAIVGEADLGPPAACDELAARYLRGRTRLSWPPPLLSDPDGITECFLQHGYEKVLVDRTTTDDAEGDAAYELADRMCNALRKEGWKRAEDWPKG